MARSILSAPAAAKVIGVHVTTLLAWARAGKLGKAAIKVSEHVTVYDRDELEKWQRSPKRTGVSMDSESKHAWARSNVLSLAKRVKWLESALVEICGEDQRLLNLKTLLIAAREQPVFPVESE